MGVGGMADLDVALFGGGVIHVVARAAADDNDFDGGKQHHEFLVDHRVAHRHHRANAPQGAGVGDVVAVVHQVGGLQHAQHVVGQIGHTQDIDHVGTPRSVSC
jgi:hypothetical protein